MSQCATLYRITDEEFESLKAADDLSLLATKETYVTLQSTHEGLRFLLAKDRSEAEVCVADAIFYPASFFEQLPETIADFPSEAAVLYHSPAAVAEISTFLKSIHTAEIEALFNPNELNEKGVYPLCWSHGTASQNGFTLDRLLADFMQLKHFFSEAAGKPYYVLSFVG